MGDGDAADAKARLVLRAGGRVVTAIEPGVRIAIVAIEDKGESARVAADLRAQGLLVNVVDQPALCDFLTPAIVDRAPVLIAIGTAGASAGMAKALRQRIEAMLPASLGMLATAVAAARGTIRARWPDMADRRRAIDAALLPGGALDPLAGGDDASVARWLAAPDGESVTGLINIGVASDDPDDLTLRAARLLGQADLVYHQPDIAPAILDRARADAVRIAAAVQPAAPPSGLALWLFHLP